MVIISAFIFKIIMKIIMKPPPYFEKYICGDSVGFRI